MYGEPLQLSENKQMTHLCGSRLFSWIYSEKLREYFRRKSGLPRSSLTFIRHLMRPRLTFFKPNGLCLHIN